MTVSLDYARQLHAIRFECHGKHRGLGYIDLEDVSKLYDELQAVEDKLLDAHFDTERAKREWLFSTDQGISPIAMHPKERLKKITELLNGGV